VLILLRPEAESSDLTGLYKSETDRPGEKPDITFRYTVILKKGEAKGIAEGKAKGIAEGKAEGFVEATQSLILRLGSKKFESPSTAITSKIMAIKDFERLTNMSEKMLDATSWKNLLEMQ
jgi:hypothetical protein